jgi:OmpA-OmpF porin, OOP family
MNSSAARAIPIDPAQPARRRVRFTRRVRRQNRRKPTVEHSMIRTSVHPGPMWGGALAAGVAMSLALFGGAVAGAPAAPAADARIAQAKPPAGEFQTRTTSLPAKGLFDGDQLTPLAKQKLTDFIVDIVGQQIEVVLVMPRGPWQIDGSAGDERSLTPARLDAVKRFLRERGVDPGRIFVESRIDEKIKEPRLDVQSVTRPGGA